MPFVLFAPLCSLLRGCRRRAGGSQRRLAVVAMTTRALQSPPCQASTILNRHKESQLAGNCRRSQCWPTIRALGQGCVRALRGDPAAGGGCGVCDRLDGGAPTAAGDAAGKYHKLRYDHDDNGTRPCARQPARDKTMGEGRATRRRRANAAMTAWRPRCTRRWGQLARICSCLLWQLLQGLPPKG